MDGVGPTAAKCSRVNINGWFMPDAQPLDGVEKIARKKPMKLPAALPWSTERETLPNGEKEEDYPRWRTWGPRKWAWEFLRRNPNFQNRCELVSAVITEENLTLAAAIAVEFGLKAFKPWYSRYTLEDPAKFTTAVTSWPPIEKFRTDFDTKERRPRSVSRSSTEVLIRFDVLPMLYAPDKSLKAQLASAALQLQRYIAAVQRAGTADGERIKRYEPHVLITQLRAYDMHKAKLTHVEISECLRPDSKNLSTGKKRSDDGSVYVKAAIELIEKNYLQIPNFAKRRR